MKALTDEQIKFAWTGSNETNRPIIGVNKVISFAREIEARAWTNAREHIAAHFEKMAEDFATERGAYDPDSGAIEFRNEEAGDYCNGLLEHADDIRAMGIPKPINPDATIPA